MYNESVLQDTIEFNLRAEHTIVNKTVKLIATVVAMVAGETTEDALRNDIKTIMKKLVDADWQFSNMQRNADDSGFERVTLTASVRVNESENYNLDNRAKDASRKGLAITGVQVDTSVPALMIEEAEGALRIDLIQQVKNEQTTLGLAMGHDYRIHRLNFHAAQNFSFSNTRLPQAMIASSNMGGGKTSYGSGFSDSEDSLGNASKLSMTVTVTFARVVIKHHTAAGDNLTVVQSFNNDGC